MFQPAYYNGRRVHVSRPKSHPANYVYWFVRDKQTRAGHVTIRLAKNEAFWRDRRPYPLP